jgi:hypothetical protein
MAGTASLGVRVVVALCYDLWRLEGVMVMYDPFIGFRVVDESTEPEAEFFEKHPKLKARLDTAGEADIHRMFDEAIEELTTRVLLRRYLAEATCRVSASRAITSWCRSVRSFDAWFTFFRRVSARSSGPALPTWSPTP